MIVPTTMRTVIGILCMGMYVVLVIVPMTMVVIHRFMLMIVAVLVAKEDEYGKNEQESCTDLHP